MGLSSGLLDLPIGSISDVEDVLYTISLGIPSHFGGGLLTLSIRLFFRFCHRGFDNLTGFVCEILHIVLDVVRECVMHMKIGRTGTSYMSVSPAASWYERHVLEKSGTKWRPRESSGIT